MELAIRKFEERFYLAFEFESFIIVFDQDAAKYLNLSQEEYREFCTKNNGFLINEISYWRNKNDAEKAIEDLTPYSNGETYR